MVKTLVSFNTVVYMGPRFTRAPRWAPNDPADNSNVEESLYSTLCPVYATVFSAKSPSEPSLGPQTRPAKHTDGASSSRLHSDDHVRPQNHQMRKTSSVCEKLLLSLFSYLFNLSLILFYVSPSVSGPNRILLCFFGMCQNPVMLF